MKIACIAVGTHKNVLEIKIQCFLTIPSSDVAYKDICNVVCVANALRLFQLFDRPIPPQRNKYRQEVLAKAGNGNHCNQMADVSCTPATVTRVGLNFGCEVNLHGTPKSMQVINPSCTHVSKGVICLSAFTLYVDRCLGNESVLDRC